MHLDRRMRHVGAKTSPGLVALHLPAGITEICVHRPSLSTLQKPNLNNDEIILEMLDGSFIFTTCGAIYQMFLSTRRGGGPYMFGSYCDACEPWT